jgi:hypothetical protein
MIATPQAERQENHEAPSAPCPLINKTITAGKSAPKVSKFGSRRCVASNHPQITTHPPISHNEAENTITTLAV